MVPSNFFGVQDGNRVITVYWFWCVCVCVCVCATHIFGFSLIFLPLLNYNTLTNKGMKFCKCRISKSIIARNLKLVPADRG